MAKELRCNDVMPGCSTVIEGHDEMEIVAKAVEHAKSEHNLPAITADFATKVQRMIRDK
jgi:predicted small metal-binding protein